MRFNLRDHHTQRWRTANTNRHLEGNKDISRPEKVTRTPIAMVAEIIVIGRVTRDEPVVTSNNNSEVVIEI